MPYGWTRAQLRKAIARCRQDIAEREARGEVGDKLEQARGQLRQLETWYGKAQGGDDDD